MDVLFVFVFDSQLKVGRLKRAKACWVFDVFYLLCLHLLGGLNLLLIFVLPVSYNSS